MDIVYGALFFSLYGGQVGKRSDARHKLNQSLDEISRISRTALGGFVLGDKEKWLSLSEYVNEIKHGFFREPWGSEMLKIAGKSHITPCQ